MGHIEETNPNCAAPQQTDDVVSNTTKSMEGRITTSTESADVLKTVESSVVSLTTERKGSNEDVSSDSNCSDVPEASTVDSTSIRKPVNVSVDVERSFLSSDGVEVHLELLSNWGHSSQIGLTEVNGTACKEIVAFSQISYVSRFNFMVRTESVCGLTAIAFAFTERRKESVLDVWALWSMGKSRYARLFLP